jgi:TldD protein
VVTVDGTDVEYEQADLTLQVTVYAAGGAGMAAGSLSVGSAGDLRVVAGLEPRVEAVCQAAVDSAAAPACEPGSYDVVCDGSLAGIWAHETIGHLAEADHQQPGAAPVVAGPAFLTVIDTGGLPGQRGHVAVDDEGVPCADVDLIRDGVIGGRLHSRATASLFGEAPTGNARAVSYRHPPIPRLRTTRILPGPHQVGEMIAGTRDGLLATGFYGGQTDRLSFAFTPAQCRRITGGEVRGLVRPPVLSGTIAGALGRIDMIGDRACERDTSASCGKLGQWPLPVSSFAPPIRVRGLDAG